MNFHILTLFPEAFSALQLSMVKRGCDDGKLSLNIVNIRDFAQNNRRQTDGYPYGGGAGMVMMPEPVYLARQSLGLAGARVAFMTPSGKPFNQAKAIELSKESDLILLCGHYEGIDQRVIDQIVTDEISLGDFVLTGGEIAAMAVVDAVARLVPGVIKEESLEDESFTNGLLEYPQYTRPPEFMGVSVPEVLLSGHHGEIQKWRREQSLERTRLKRPDLLEKLEKLEK